MTAPTLPDLERLCDQTICLGGHRLAGIAPGDDGARLAPHRRFSLPEDLLGTPIPPEWLGVALVAGGHGSDPDDLAGACAPVGLAYVLTRSGQAAVAVWTPDATHRQSGEPGVRGHVVDVARRLLDLPTEVEPTPPVRLLHLAWLDDLISVAAAGTPLRWVEAAARHPAFAGDTDPEALAAEAARRYATTSWTGLWRRYVEEGLGLGTMSPRQVAHLDEGSFARFAISLTPDPDELRELLGGLAAPEVDAGVRATVAATERHLRATSASPTVRHRDNRCR